MAVPAELEVGVGMPTAGVVGKEVACKARTGLLPQEPSELCSTFSRDLPRQHVLFWRGPASVSHGKTPPPIFFAKKCRGRKIDLFPSRKSHFFSSGKKLISLRAQRAFLEKFCGLVVQRDAISHSVSKPQKNPRALCQSNVTILKRFQGSTRRQSERITDFFRFFETISSTIDCARALTPRE